MSETGNKNYCRCFSCNAIVPNIDGEVHKYMDSSPGCWYLFGKILEKEFSIPSYKTNSRLTIDAYAIQHYGKLTVPQAVKSVNHHLISLTFYFYYKMNVKQSDAAFKKLAQFKENFKWIEPPKNIGDITVVDVLKAQCAQEHLKLVDDWAYKSWIAWKQHHHYIRNFIETHYSF
jgi:Family of unknown function (DUF5946)